MTKIFKSFLIVKANCSMYNKQSLKIYDALNIINLDDHDITIKKTNKYPLVQMELITYPLINCAIP